MIALSDNRDCA